MRLLIAEELPAAELARAAAHLGSCHTCRDAIVRSAGGPQRSRRISQALTRGAWVKSGELALRAGDVVGAKYRLLSLIGEGGSSSVWRAERLDWRAPVALKLLIPPAQESREFVARFEREVRLAAALRSPNVTQILDHGVDDRTAHPFIAMELLEGETLEQRLKRSTRLSAAETGVTLAQVGRALVRAHSVGVVHRDLKPANIFIVRDLDQEVVKVLDFGVAKSRAWHGKQSLVTTPGTVLGTPSYMSPEQIRASTDLDQHADLWSLAVIACECLTGQKPFVGKGFLEVALLVLEESKRPIPSKLGPAPAKFDAWFERATHPNRAKRFQSAREALDALLPICETASGRARREAVQAPAATDRHRGDALGRFSKYVVFAGAVGVSFALWFRTVHLQQQNLPTAQQSTADTLTVAKTELVAAPSTLPRVDPVTPARALPTAEQQAAAPETIPRAVAVDSPQMVSPTSPKERPSVQAPSARKPPQRPRNQAQRARPTSGNPEEPPAGDGSPIRIDLSQ